MMRFRPILVASLALFGAACELFQRAEDAPPPDPFLPFTEGWVPEKPVVEQGQFARFTLEIEWPRPPDDGFVVSHTYENWGAVNLVWTDATHAEISVPTDGMPVLSVGGTLSVCQGDSVYEGVCEWLALPESYVRVAGGQTNAVMFPIDEATLSVGEARPLQATPIGWRWGLTGPQENRNDTVHTQDPVSYESGAPSVFSVDEVGVVRGLSAGEGELIARAGGAEARLPIVVNDALIDEIPEHAWPITTRFWGGELYSDTGRKDQSWDMLAWAPDGGLWALSRAEIAWIDEKSHISLNNPLHLVSWTGTGLGYERVSHWGEQTTESFVQIDFSGHQYVGWRSNDAAGLTLLDRPAGSAPGAWRRRHLSADPDLNAAQRFDVPRWDPETPVRVATVASEDGVWIAYAWGQGVDRPLAGWPSDCARFLRLAHVTPDRIDVEDVALDFFYVGNAPDRGRCEDGFEWHSLPEWGELRLGPPVQGSSKPVIVANTTAFGYGLTGWTRVDGPGAAPLVAVASSWSPGADPEDPVFDVVGFAGRGVANDEGRVWTISAHPDLWTQYNHWRPRNDSPFAPHFPGAYQLGRGAEQPYASFAAGWGRFAMLTKLPPPYAPYRPPTAPIPVWLYVTNLPTGAADPTAPLQDGRRLAPTADTPWYPDAFALNDGSAFLWRGRGVHEGIGGRDLTAHQHVDAAGPALGPVFPSSTHEQLQTGDVVYWSNGEQVFAAASQADHELLVSEDGGASFTSALRWASTSPVAAATSTPNGDQWVLTGDNYTRALYRLRSEGGVWAAEAVELPVLPVNAITNVDTVALWPDDAGLWVLQVAAPGGQLTLYTARWTPSGGMSGSVVANLPDQTRLRAGGAMANGTLIVPLAAGVLVSTDGGASFVTAQSPVGPLALVETVSPGFVALADGRAAWVDVSAVRRGQHVVMFTSTNGQDWAGPVDVAPRGGAWQRAWAATGLADGALLVHYGDSGTMMGDPYVQGSTIQNPMTMNNTVLDGVVIRVVP